MGDFLRGALVAFGVVVVLAGCAPSDPSGPDVDSSAVSAQPEVDAAVVASLPEQFASAHTVLDSNSGECLTTVTTLPGRYGLSAASVSETVDLLRTGGEELECRPVLRVVRDDGEHLDISHIAKYLPLEARDGDLVIPDQG